MASDLHALAAKQQGEIHSGHRQPIRNLITKVGSTFGMFLGALVVGFTANGMVLMGIPFYFQTIAYGVILIGTLLLSQKFDTRASR